MAGCQKGQRLFQPPVQKNLQYGRFWSWLRKRRRIHNRLMGAFINYGNGFLGWNYRLLEQDLSTVGFGQEADYLADRLRVRQDKEFVYRFHEAMKRQGYAHRNEGWNEGPDICYYESKASADKKRPYLFRLLSWKSELRLYLCIRNA